MPHLKSTIHALVMGITGTCMVCCSSKPTVTVEESTVADTVQPAPVSARPVRWGYAGEDGPTDWATLRPVYALCGEGKGQSPINIVKTDAKGGVNWKLDYKTTSLKIAHNEHMDDIIDNGHTIQVTVDEGSTFSLNSDSFCIFPFTPRL